jgi:phospholipase/carboxylesterase
MNTPIESFVHQWVPGTPGHARVILALHGTGGDEHDLIPLAQTLDPHAAILSPRGRVDEQGSNRFFRRLSEGVFDLENMRQETLALSSFVKDAAGKYGFGQESLYAVGFSNGANMAASLLLTEPSSLSGGVLIRAMVPFVPQSLPDLTGKRIFVSSGRFDPLVPLDNAVRLVEMFKEAGAKVEHLVLETGHNLTREDISAAQAWLKT